MGNVSIPIPDSTLSSDSRFLTATTHNYSHEHAHKIGTSMTMLMFMARQVILEEMNALKEADPSFDFQRIQDLLNGDPEMFQLAVAVLNEHVPYTGNLLEAMRKWDASGLEDWLDAYGSLNHRNILNKPL